MKNQHGNGEVIFSLILIVITLSASSLFNYMSCHSRWKDSGVKGVSWGPIQGCKVKLDDGRWLPDDRVREIDISPKEVKTN